MSYTYEQIKQVLVKDEFNESTNTLTCHFKASNQEQELQGVHVFMPDEKKIMKHAGKKAVKQGLFSSLFSIFGRAAGSAVGGGLAGSAVSSATRSGAQAAYNAKSQNESMMPKVEVTEEMKKEGIVKAFESIASFYELNGGQLQYKTPVAP